MTYTASFLQLCKDFYLLLSDLVSGSKKSLEKQSLDLTKNTVSFPGGFCGGKTWKGGLGKLPEPVFLIVFVKMANEERLFFTWIFNILGK